MSSMSEYEAALLAGTSEHYEDAALYDHEYRRRRDDVRWYRRLAAELGGPLHILELGCGSGRLLLPLCRDGHTVIGVDRSAAMLRQCQARLSRFNTRARARVHIIQGDFRCLPLADLADARFPLVICPFNAFLHLYTREDVERFLAEVKRLLAPGGLFAFDIVHPDPAWLARDPSRRFARTRFRHPVTGERLVYSTSQFYDPATQIMWIRLYYEPQLDGASAAEAAAHPASRVVTITQRLFFPAEIEALLHYAGFQVVRHAGGFAEAPDGEPLTPVSAEQVICARVR